MTRLAAVYGQGALYLVGPFARALRGIRSRGVEVDLSPDENLSGDARAAFDSLRERLEREAYPYADLLLQYGGDNQGPDPELVPLLRHLARLPDMPAVTLTTPSVFFRHMEQDLGDRIPVIRGVIADPWNLRLSPQPVGLKQCRSAQRLVAPAESRLAALAADAPPAAGPALAEIRWNLQLYADHTCGLSEWGWEKTFERAGRNCRSGAFDRYRLSWATKRFYGECAWRGAAELDRVLRQRLAGGLASAEEALLVWNQTAYARGGIAEFYRGRGQPGLTAIRDAETGAEIPFRCLGPSRYALLAPPAPGFGWRLLVGEPGPAPAVPALHPASAAFTLENERFAFAFDAAGSLRSIRDLASGAERLDPAAAFGFGDVVYQVLNDVPYGVEQAGMSREWRPETLPIRTERVEVEDAAPVFRRVIAHRAIAGPAGRIGIRCEYRLPATGANVEVRVRVDKPESAAKEALHVYFPFAGRGQGFRFDQNIGSVSPSTDLAPGAMQDLFLCASWCGVETGSDLEALLACPDAPVVQLGGIRIGRWDETLPFRASTGHVACLLYHNLLNTDCPVWQDVLDEFRFIACFESVETGAAGPWRWAVGVSQPPLVQAAAPAGDPALAARAPSNGVVLELSSPDIRLLTVRRIAAGLEVTVENCAEHEARVNLRSGFEVSRAMLCTLGGEELRSCECSFGAVSVSLEPLQVAVLRLAVPVSAAAAENNTRGF